MKTYINHCYFFVMVTIGQSRCGQLSLVLCCYINIQPIRRKSTVRLSSPAQEENNQ